MIICCYLCQSQPRFSACKKLIKRFLWSADLRDASLQHAILCVNHQKEGTTGGQHSCTQCLTPKEVFCVFLRATLWKQITNRNVDPTTREVNLNRVLFLRPKSCLHWKSFCGSHNTFFLSGFVESYNPSTCYAESGVGGSAACRCCWFATKDLRWFSPQGIISSSEWNRREAPDLSCHSVRNEIFRDVGCCSRFTRSQFAVSCVRFQSAAFIRKKQCKLGTSRRLSKGLFYSRTRFSQRLREG